MAEILFLLAAIGGLVSLGGWVWLLVLAFGEGIGWGLGCLLCSPVSLIFGILHFDRAWQALALHIGGSVGAWAALQAASLVVQGA